MSKDIEEIQEDISRARDWAREHFNAYVDEETTPSHLLAQKVFVVEFPEPDIMSVYPIMYGKPMFAVRAEYRLLWIGERLFWKGGLLLRPDIVARLEVT